MKRTQQTKLSLHRETLRALAGNSLGYVVGGMKDQSDKVCPPPSGGSAALMCTSADPFQCNTAFVCSV